MITAITCSCGARIEGQLLAWERAEFLEAHAICRTTPTVDLAVSRRRGWRLRAI